MARLIAVRLSTAVPTLVLVSILSFGIIHLVPGDPVFGFAGTVGATSPEQLHQLRVQLGLLDPLPVQYIHFVRDVFTGHLRSLKSSESVTGTYFQLFPSTFQLTTAAMAIATVVGTILGVVAATRIGTLIDTVTMLPAAVGLSVPNFVLGIGLIYLFALVLHLLPATGGGTLEQLILPAVTLSLYHTGLIARLVRATLSDVLREDFILLAKAKGLSTIHILGRHALRHVVLPVMTLIGLNYGYLLGGAVIVETVFARPGIGRFLVQGILADDYSVVQGVILLTAILIIVVNLITDLLYAFIDPRIAREPLASR